VFDESVTCAYSDSRLQVLEEDVDKAISLLGVENNEPTIKSSKKTIFSNVVAAILLIALIVGSSIGGLGFGSDVLGLKFLLPYNLVYSGCLI